MGSTRWPNCEVIVLATGSGHCRVSVGVRVLSGDISSPPPWAKPPGSSAHSSSYLWVLQELQLGVLAGGEMIICRHLVGCFVGEFYYKDSFGDFCGSRVAVLIGSVYGSRLRVGGIVHCVHRYKMENLKTN